MARVKLPVIHESTVDSEIFTNVEAALLQQDSASVPPVVVHILSGLSAITPGGPFLFNSPLGLLCGSNCRPAVRCCVLTPQGS